MKLYYFNPNSYGPEYFVMAESEKDAFAYVAGFLIANGEDSYWWKDFSKGKLPKGYTIDVYEQGQVIQSEIC